MRSGFALVLGGARSGKSAFAEKLVLASGLSPVYLASAEAWDEEMRQRIAAHRAARSGNGWITHEVPLQVPEFLARCREDQAVLFDCTTLWLSNLMLDGQDPGAATDALLAALAACPAKVVVVSNEVGQGIVPDNAEARTFRDAQGRMNQALAAEADLAVAVMAGLPLVLKGRMPEGLT